MSTSENEQISRLKEAIARLESQRDALGDEVVDAAVASMRESIASLKVEEQSLEQQRKFATILFADVVGSTQIGQHLDPEEILNIMDRSLKRLAIPVEKHSGHITRFMGDGIKAIFGYPVAHEDDPIRAVQAGLEIIQESHEFAQKLRGEFGIEDFQVRVGINTGLVIIGGLTEGEDTVMGSPVNLAARLESAAPAGGLLISLDTYRHVKGEFEVEPLEPIEMRGFDALIPVYLVKSTRPLPYRTGARGVEGVETRTIGRDAEIKYLEDSYHAILEEGEGRVITVTGEAGIGKSRLLYEFKNWLESLSQVSFQFAGRARQETQNLPYAVLRDVITSHFKIQDDEPVALVREKVERGFGKVFGEDDYGRLRAHFLGQLLGFDLGESVFLRGALGNPQQFRNRALSFLGEYFSALSLKAPVLLFLEDIHWADDSTLDAVNYLGRRTPGQRLLILCLARPILYERRRFWGEGQTYHRRLDLTPLSKAESRQLVSEILQKSEQATPELNDLVTKGAEGNPFFIEELIKVLIEDGVIVKAEKAWQVRSERLTEVNVPASLTGVLQARLDSLPDEEKVILQQASIVGRIFWDQVVAHIQLSATGNRDREVVFHALESLRVREMVFRREESAFAGSREYYFKHEMLREVTYETVPKKLRRGYHGQVADWLIENSAGRAEEATGLIADHLERAGRMREATNYLLLSGDKARILYAHQEAADYYQRAVNLLKREGDNEGAAKTLMKLGLTFHTAFDYERSRQAYAEGFALWQRAEKAHPEIELPQAPHELRMVWSDPPDLDPTMGGTNWMAAIETQLFCGLVAQSPEMEVIPDIAHSWEMLDDGKKYIFHLRDDVYWSDGIPITADDFEFTIKRALDPKTRTPVAGLLLYGIRGARAFHQGQTKNADHIGVHAIDKTTLVIELEEPTSYFMQDLSYYVLLPVPRHVIETYGAAWAEPEHIVSNGPFRLAAWRRGEYMVLERNPRYHGRFNGNAERIHLRLGVKPKDQYDLYVSGQLDLVYNWFTETSVIDEIRHQFPDEYLYRPRFVTIYLILDNTKPPFDDRRVRQAFVTAIDRETLANALFKGYELAGTGGFVPPGMPGHSPDIGLAYDPVRARRLLGESGRLEDPSLSEITCLSASSREAVASYLHTQWRDNLKVEILTEILDPLTFFNRLREDRPAATINGWWADYADPDNFLRVCVKNIVPGWRNESYDNLLERARQITDQNERLILYQQADRILMEEAVIVPLIYSQQHMMLKPWVRKFETTAIKNPGFLKDVIIDPH